MPVMNSAHYKSAYTKTTVYYQNMNLMQAECNLLSDYHRIVEVDSEYRLVP